MRGLALLALSLMVAGCVPDGPQLDFDDKIDRRSFWERLADGFGGRLAFVWELVDWRKGIEEEPVVVGDGHQVASRDRETLGVQGLNGVNPQIR